MYQKVKQVLTAQYHVCVCVYVCIAAQDHIETNVEHAYNDVSHGNQQLERGVQLKVSKIECQLMVL